METAQVVDHCNQEGAIGMDGPTTSERHISSSGDDVVINNVDQLEDYDDPGGGERQVWLLTQF